MKEKPSAAPAHSKGDPSQGANPSETTIQLSPEERMAKLEENQTRMASMLQAVITFLDQNKTIQGASPGMLGAAAPSRGLPKWVTDILPTVAEAAKGIFTQPQQQDPFAQEVMKGVRESYAAGLKQYLESINQRAKLGDLLIEAFAKGKLKIEPENVQT